VRCAEQARCRVARLPVAAHLREGSAHAIHLRPRASNGQADPDLTEHFTTLSRAPAWSIPKRPSATDPRRRREQRRVAIVAPRGRRASVISSILFTARWPYCAVAAPALKRQASSRSESATPARTASRGPTPPQTEPGCAGPQIKRLLTRFARAPETGRADCSFGTISTVCLGANVTSPLSPCE
jgi:hypothetical protein